MRDGILAQMLAEQDPKATAHQEFERERWQGVLATCKRYGVIPGKPTRCASMRCSYSATCRQYTSYPRNTAPGWKQRP